MDARPTMGERFAGCLVGQAVGDGLGAPFEGLSSDMIYGGFGRPTDVVARPPVEVLYCTDDTHMALGVAEVLCARGEMDEDVIQRALVAAIPDFEDAIQYFSAVGAGAEVLITRNVRDFPRGSVRVKTPAEFVAERFGR